MLADIATGDTGAADVLFLIAAILFGVAALVYVLGLAMPAQLRAALAPAGACLVAVGLLLL